MIAIEIEKIRVKKNQQLSKVTNCNPTKLIN